MKKKFPWLIFAIIIEALIISVLAQAFTRTTFEDGTNGKNLTFNTGGEWFTETINLPAGNNVTNAYLYLNGSNVTLSGPSSLLETRNYSIAFENITWCASGCQPMINPQFSNDGKFDTYSTLQSGGWHQYHWDGNFTKPKNETGKKYEIISATLDYKIFHTKSGDLPCSIWCYQDNTSSTTIESWGTLVYGIRTRKSIPAICFNNSLEHIRIHAYCGLSSETPSFYDFEVNYTYSNVTLENSSYPSNVTIYLNNISILYNYGEKNGSILNHKVFANITINATEGNPQNISFRSNTTGILEYSGFYLAYVNSFAFNIRDEDTGNIIINNITVEILKGENISFFWTTNGRFKMWDNWDGDYTVSFYNQNYSRRSYAYTFAGGESKNETVYLANQSSTTIFTIQDRLTADIITDALISQSRIIDGAWVIVASKYSDVTGKAQFTYVPNIRYLFQISKSGYTTKSFYLDPIIFSTYTVALDKHSTSYWSLDLEDVLFIINPQDFINGVQNNISVGILSGNNILSSYSVFISYPGGTTSANGLLNGGETFPLQFTITGAGMFDTINFTFAYTTIGNTSKNFTYQYTILNGEIPAYTWAYNKGHDQGTGFFERSLLSVIATIIMGGIAGAAVGPLGAGVMMMLTMGLCVYIGWIPFYAIIPAIVIGIAIIATRSSE
jgi:hypothetical protein